MIIYLACLLVGLLGILITFSGRHSEAKIIVGAGLYFAALFAAAIISMHGVP